jgi:regulator of protease activity HflC (stomatin/prohibitin superfamily)
VTWIASIWDIIWEVLSFFQIFSVLEPYEGGVVTRLGKYKRTVGSGIVWYLPLGIDEVTKENVATETAEMGTQSLTTKDGKTIQVACVITYHIFDCKRYLLDVEDASDALTDAASGYITDQVASTTWAQIRKPGFSTSLKPHIQRQARKWGIAVTNLQFSDLVCCATIRVLQA